MRITVLGASGMAGTAVVNEALSRGHEVMAVSRQRGHRAGARLTSCMLDVADVEGVAGLLHDSDAAVVALRPPAGHESDLARLTTAVLDAASRGRTPLLIIGGAAPLRSPGDPGTLAIDDPTIVPPAWRDVAQASLDQFRACQAHSYKGWVYLSPPAIFAPGDATGSYRRGTAMLLRDACGQSRISPEDLALAVVDELEHPGGEQHIIVVAGDPGDSDPGRQEHVRDPEGA